MRKVSTLLLAAAVSTGFFAPSANAAPLAPDVLLGPSKYEPVVKAISELNLSGASTSIPSFYRDGNGYADGTDWRPFESPLQRQNRLAYQSATAAQGRALATNVNVIGQLIYDEGKEYDPDNNDWLGFYSLPHNSNASFTLAGYTNGPINRGGYADFDDRVYRGIYLQNFSNTVAFKYLVTFDLNTFQTLEVKDLANTDFSMAGTAVAKNPADSKVYGCFFKADGTGLFWGTVDYLAQTTATITELTLDQRLHGLAFTDAGVAYGLRETTYGSKNLELVKINIATGEQELVAPTELPFQYAFGMTWNAQNSTLLATFNTEEQGSGLAEINPATGDASLIADFNADRQVVNLFIKPDTKDKVPAAPTITASAPEGTMTCDYSVVLPTTLKDGTPISGAVEWFVTLEGETINEGKNMAGTTVTGHITLDKPGYREFLAYCVNADGRSLNAKARIFVGKGICDAPANVVLAWDEATSTMSATWDAVTKSADGGYINPADVTYTVTDKDGQTLASGLTATTFSLEMEAPFGRTEFVWSVTADYDGRSSASTASNSIFLGALVPPYDYDFTLRKEFTLDGFTTIDANNDGVCFMPNGLGARCGHSDQKINMNDWLVLPGIYLEAGKSYLFTLTVHCYQNTNAEIVEVYAGSEPTTAALKTQVIASTTIKSNRTAPSVLTGVITPTADGIQYIGIHAKSTANKGTTTYHVMVPHVSLGAAMDPLCPKAPTNVSVIPAADGSLGCGVAYTAPTSSMGGKSYQAGPSGPPTMLKMMVFVGDEDTPRQTMSVPGGYSGNFPQAITFDERGDKTVRVVAEAPTGQQSIPTEATGYVGPYEPKAPTNVRITEVYQPGTIRMEWDAVTQDVNGKDLPAGHTSYMIYGHNAEGQPVAMLEEPLPGQTFYVFDALEDVTKQRFLSYSVSAFNWDFESKQKTSNYIPVGVPYSMPVKYSNMDDLLEQASATAVQGFGQFGVFKEGSVPSQDGDGEFFGSRGQYTNDAAMLRTGIISLVGATNPEVVLYTYKLADGDRNIVQVAVWYNERREVIRFDRHDDMPAGEWTKLRFDLAKWKNKNVQIEVTMGCLSISDTYVDNIVIRDTPDFDLAVTGINAPSNIPAGKDFIISATIENIGMKDAGEFDVTLLCDGEPVDTRRISSLEVDDDLYIEFTHRLSLFTEGGKGEYAVVCNLEGDAAADNNRSATATVNRQISTLQAPEGLSGEAKEEGNLVTWLAVSDAEAGPVTESFEEGEPWADYFGGWTFIDRDGSPLGTIVEIDIPCVEHGVTTGSFFVFDTELLTEESPKNLTTHSGSKFIFSMYRRDNRSVDDWAISPMLDGKEQTISFFAKSLTGRYPEQIEVLYTFNDDFVYDQYTKVDGFGTKLVPEEWTEYTALIPAGAKHFAIRSRAANGMMLLIDDVTFSPMKQEVIGYNVYRDAEKLNDAPVAATEYLDTKASAEPHTYHVTALYAEGESELSAPLVLEPSALGSVMASAMSVTAEGLDIVVSNAGVMPVTIASVDGRQLHLTLGDTRFTVPAAGVYLVTVGTETFKLIAK